MYKYKVTVMKILSSVLVASPVIDTYSFLWSFVVQGITPDLCTYV
jgi:hypothetical protein